MSAHAVRAAVLRDPGRSTHIEELRLADPGPDEVRVGIVATAICGSDLAYIDGEWNAPRPAVFGHEAAGIVDSIGPGVTEVAVGDRVVVTLVRACGSCPRCGRGNPVVCAGGARRQDTPLRDGAGRPVHQGLRVAGFATAAVVHHSQVVRIGNELGLDLASLLACGVLTGVGAVMNTANVEPGSHVVVLGCGGVGLNVVQGARLARAATVTAYDPDPQKGAAAIRLGASGSFAEGEDLKAGVLGATGGEMADYVFVATSSVAAVEVAFGLLAPMGALVLVGMPATGVTARLDVGTVAALNQRVLGSKMGSSRPAEDVPRLVALYREGRLQLESLVSGRYPLERINEALDSTRAGEALRNLVIMDESLV